MNEITNIENSLEASTAKDDLLDIIGGAADYSLENFLKMGDGIPIVSYFTKGVKATLAIRDFLFMEKVIEFLKEVGKESTANRKKMIDKIQEDSDYSEKFGKVSLIALERYDELAKAKYLGLAAKYLARENIAFSLYKRLAFVIDRMYVTDMVRFATASATNLSEYLKAELSSLGLLTSSTVVKNTSIGSSELVKLDTKWSLTEIGQTFKDIIREKRLVYLEYARDGKPLEFAETSRYSRQ